MERRLVLWCPDWPVVAAALDVGRTGAEPVAVFRAGRVLACSERARAHGVRRGQRRRPAEGVCPELVVFAEEPARDARVFEPVVSSVEAMAPGVEVVRPGVVSVPVRGPAGYFGGEEAASERVVDRIEADTGVECRAGVADGLFAALLASRRGRIVPRGMSADFLAPLAIDELDQPGDDSDHAELVDLLHRLGVRTLGDFAALPEREVTTRFGSAGAAAHRLARGAEERPPIRRKPSPELAVHETLDPPADRVDTVAFAARTLAERLHAVLRSRGLACVQLGVTARTEHGEERHRVWRCAEPLTSAGTADRVRWQLDGWLHRGDSAERPTAGVRTLSLQPVEVVDAAGLQQDLVASGAAAAADRAGRTLVRVQGMLGPGAVLTGVLGGGRSPADRVRWLPWGEERRQRLSSEPPWPGRLPAPSPTVLPDDPPPAEVLDADGNPVVVTERGLITATPYRVVARGGPSRRVLSWAGPWPYRERWWLDGPQRTDYREGGAPPRTVERVQVVLDGDGGEEALLLTHAEGSWHVEGRYL